MRCKRNLQIVSLLVLSAVVVFSTAAVAPSPASSPVAESLRARLEQVAVQGRVPVGDGEIRSFTALPLFYERRLYAPAWLGPRRPLAVASALMRTLGEAGRYGLRGEDYHLAEIRELFRRIDAGEVRPDVAADLDLLLTDAFLIYGAHVVSGRVSPETFDPEWVAVRREVDLVALLEEALGDRRPAEALHGLLPADPAYGRLVEALALYRGFAAAGGWEPVPGGPTLRRLEKDEAPAPERLAALAARLRATRDLAGEPPDGEFDERLEEAVVRFQRRHGLEPDGAAGSRTLEALNVPAADRVRQIELNLERWRWMPRDLGPRYVLVNVPDFTLQVIDGGRPALEMRVVVGRRYRNTPVFSDVMRYLVLNPYWEVPRKLAVEDKLPEIQRDPEYLSRMGFRVYEGWGGDSDEIDPATIDWTKLGKLDFPYRLRQDPGPENALGAVKFMFPNKFNVYLHDTPARELFRRADRAASSGCIRLEKPLELAEYLLAEAGWDRESLLARLAEDRDRTVPLPRPIPVHLQYWTAWADETGAVHFRNDVYGRDVRLASALAAAAPGHPP